MSVITKTPFRISICGGGTDYPEYINEYGPGNVVGFTFNKYSYVHYKPLLPVFDYKSRIALKEVDLVNDNTQIKNKIVKSVLGYNDKGFEISHVSDLPGGTGIGSSSAFLAGLVKAVNPNLNDHYLYREVITLEQAVILEKVGYQDACFAAIGGFNTFKFYKNGVCEIAPWFFNYKESQNLVDHFTLFYLGDQRNASSIASDYKYCKENHKDLNNLTNKTILAIMDRNYEEVGSYMNESWEIKKSLSPLVNNEKIECAMNIGLWHSWGGKVIGAGGGGCAVFISNLNKKSRLIQEMSEVGFVNIPIEFESRGCHVIG